MKKNRRVLLQEGFTLQQDAGETRTFSQRVEEEEILIPDPYREVHRLVSPSVESSEEQAPLEDIGDRPEKFSERIAYEDPFRVIAGRFLADSQGWKIRPRVVVWDGDVKRLQDPLPPDFFQWKKFKRDAPKNRIRFQDVSSAEVQAEFLLTKTHWGNKLLQLCKEGSGEIPRSTAKTMVRVLKDFLHCKPDPRWTTSFTEKVYGEDHHSTHRSRSQRLLECLKTVEGMFAQRFLAFPHEVWTWDKFDVYTLKNLYELISDEFLDGQLTEFGQGLDTRFAELKRLRKSFKAAAHNNALDAFLTNEGRNFPRWLRHYLPLYQEVNCEEDESRKIYLTGILSQTRGAGKPPPLVILQAKRKFLETVTCDGGLRPGALGLVHAAVGEIINEIPDHIFTGLATKAAVSVNASSCWEKTRKEGGSLAALQEICAGRDLGVQAIVRCLETGRAVRYLESDATAGEYIFWRCLDDVLKMPPEERSKIALVVVTEPGKARAVTKSHVAVKVVLDFVSHICAIPLAKGVASSHSGMEKANHAWNLFKDFDSKPLKDMVFNVERRDDQEYEDYGIRSETYSRIWAVSTDYQTATDFLDHNLAGMIGLAWMTKCGIPRILRNLVCEIAYRSRHIEFHGNMGIGAPVHGKTNVFCVQTRRGVMMGDPLTKVVLHLVNVVVRRVASRIKDPLFFEAICPGRGNSLGEIVK